MRARLLVFPIKGRNWCFTRSKDSLSQTQSSLPPPTLKDLWKRVTSDSRPARENAEIMADFVAEKMNRGWVGLEKAPAGSIKSKIHSVGLKLLSRVKPSEIFLKSLSKDITKVEVTFPASLNPRFVRRRLRHIAMRGSAIHKQYFYGSLSLLPITTAFSVLPLPNIPFFWILFRAYSNWTALKGSERLLVLVSDCSRSWSSLTNEVNGNRPMSGSKQTPDKAPCPPWVLQPSEDLERLLLVDESGDDESDKGVEDGVSDKALSSICEKYNLEKRDVFKYKDSV